MYGGNRSAGISLLNKKPEWIIIFSSGETSKKKFRFFTHKWKDQEFIFSTKCDAASATVNKALRTHKETTKKLLLFKF